MRETDKEGREAGSGSLDCVDWVSSSLSLTHFFIIGVDYVAKQMHITKNKQIL